MSLTFAGNTTDKIDHGNNVSLRDLTTVTGLFWVRATQLSDIEGGTICEKTPAGYATFREFTIIGASPGALYISIKRTGEALARANGTIVEGVWNFVGFSWDGSNAPKLYVGTESVVVVEPTYTSQVADSGAYASDAAVNYTVGRHPEAAQEGWFGDIAWHGMWNRVLTLAEIQAQQFNPSPTSGCVLFVRYGVDGFTGAQHDMSGNQNTGTLTGVTIGTSEPSGVKFRNFPSKAIITPDGISSSGMGSGIF